MKKVTILILLLIFSLAYFLRVVYLPQNALTFGYDQARDHLQATAIISGDLKIQGPPASTPGMHHGVFWFYYLIPPVLISGGNPIVSAYWNAFFNAFVVFIVFSMAYLFTRSKLAGMLSAFFFAISFESTQYATWLSNPTVGAWSVPLIYLGLWLWINKVKSEKLKSNNFGPIIAGLGFGLSVQANVFLLYHTVPIILWLWIASKNISKKQIILFLSTFIIFISPMLISEAKFGFKSFAGVLSLASSRDAVVASKQLGDFIILFFNQLGKVYAFNSYPGNIGYGGIFVLSLLMHSILLRKEKNTKITWHLFLATWLLAHATVVTVGGTSTPFLLVGIGPAVSILIGIYLSKWWSQNKLVTLTIAGILTFGNLNMIVKENQNGQTIFAIQKDMLLSKQISAIDYTYSESDGRQFSINTLTSPLYINIVWTYLYEWYGEARYGYSPTWHGRDQVGQLAGLKSSERSDTYFLVIEPLSGIPPKFRDELLAEEGYYSSIEQEKTFGKELVVQKRALKNQLEIAN